MEKHKGLWRLLADRMDLPAEPDPGKPALELLGENRLVAEHHKGILDYSRQEIRIRVSFGAVVVRGENLELSLMSGEQLIISGKIQNIALEGGKSR